MEIVMLLIAVLIVILIMYVSMYNKLVKSRNSVLEAKSGIDISLLKRFDLITDLVEVVKGYTKYESETLNKLISLRNNNNSEFNETNESLNEITNSLNVVIEKYPDLKASEQFLNLQKNMANVEEHLQASRRFYNNNVTRFNNLTEQFPSSIIASNHNFKAMELFKTEVEKLAKVSVSF